MAGKQDSKEPDGRAARLKAALRDNLRKRKERDRATESDAESNATMGVRPDAAEEASDQQQLQAPTQPR